MSIDFSANLVCGVRLSELAKVVTEEKSVTKYDPDTGKPVQKKVEIERFFWCGRECERPDCFIYGKGNLVKKPLSVFDTGLYSEDDEEDDFTNRVVGVAVEGEDDIQEVKQEDLARLLESAQGLLSECGYNGPVSLFLVKACG